MTPLYPLCSPRALARWLPTLLLWIGACRAPELQRYEYDSEHMGTRFKVLLYAANEPQAAKAAAAAFDRIAELDASLSDWDAASELRQLCARSADSAPDERFSLSTDLNHVLAAALAMARRTGGAFDPTVGPYTRLWRRSRQLGELPRPQRLAGARVRVGHHLLILDPQARRLGFLAQDMRLDLGGIAKGFALDEALAVIAEHGIERALVDGGGDLALGAAPPGKSGWIVALENAAGPGADREEATWLSLAHVGIATSGDTYRFVEIEGVRYSHIVDPQTGLGLTQRIAASVLAPTAMAADAWASALCVMGPQAGLAALVQVPSLEARVTTVEKEAFRPCETLGFRDRLWVHDPDLAPDRKR